jgi:cell division protein FtsA
MGLKRKKEYLASIDLGTSKTTCIVCEINDEDRIEVIGFGCSPAKGLKKGMIINLEEVLSSIKSAVEEAEMMSEITVGEAFVGIAGTHIKSFNSTGATTVKGKHGEISESDIYDVIEAAQTVLIPEDREIIHLLPMEFIVDGHEGVTDPLGMNGSRLEVRVHIITGSISSIKNVISCINKAGIEVKDVVSNQLASAQATAFDDEKNLGVSVADIGAGTTDLSVYSDGHLEYTTVLPLGGDHFTNDIAVGLRTTVHTAEKIKRKYGDLDSNGRDDEALIKIDGIGNGDSMRKIPVHLLNEILMPRAEELVTIIKSDLERMGHFENINAGMILTGGGSLLRGFPNLAEKIVNLPVRIGTPAANMAGLSEVTDSPAYAASVGILQYGHMNYEKRRMSPFLRRKPIQRIRQNLKEVFSSLF